MTPEQINRIITDQKKYYAEGHTLPVSARINALKKLYFTIKERESEIHAAIKEDLGKGAFESYMCEVGLSLLSLIHI